MEKYAARWEDYKAKYESRLWVKRLLQLQDKLKKIEGNSKEFLCNVHNIIIYFHR